MGEARPATSLLAAFIFLSNKAVCCVQSWKRFETNWPLLDLWSEAWDLIEWLKWWMLISRSTKGMAYLQTLNDQNPKWRAVSEDSCRQIMFWSFITRSWFDHQTRLGVLLRACPWYGCSYASGLGMAWSITWLDLAQSRTQIRHFLTKWQTVLSGNCEPNSEVQTIELSSCFVKCWLLIMVSLGSSEPI
jgi:hypothetical protein